MPKNKGVRLGGNKWLPPGPEPTLKDLGITKMQSSRMQAIARIPKEDFERYLATAKRKTQAGLHNLARRFAPARGREVVPFTLPAGVDIRDAQDFRQLLGSLAYDSIDLIPTDLDWSAEHLRDWEDLAASASPKLKPGGRVAVFCGYQNHPAVWGSLGRGLEYQGYVDMHHWGARSVITPPGASVVGTLVYILAKPPARSFEKIRDNVLEVGRERGLHKYQKELAGFEYLIDILTKPGDLVCDPCCGSGTAAVAAMHLNRRFIGSDIDPEAVATARWRVAEEYRRMGRRGRGTLIGG